MILQVKYCYSEEELNDFLSTLNVTVQDDSGKLLYTPKCPRLQSIQYLPKVKGEQHEYINEDGEKMCRGEAGCDIVAVVMYFTYKDLSSVLDDIIKDDYRNQNVIEDKQL